jgi:C4-dicarboxylate-specific signal transduction histidine kinase
VADLIAGVDRLMSATFHAKGVNYDSLVEPANLVATLDPHLIEQAIINLLTNALDAVGDAPEPRIGLSVGMQENRTVIAITDNGPGLAVEALDKLFVPFFTTKPGGSGIGLSIARQIALAHHGQVEAENNPSGGATFTLTLPNRD